MGNTTYHSLQMKVEKQFSQGLFLLSSFTWSKTLTDASSALSGFFSTSARDHYNRKVEKGLAQFDVPARLVVAFNYELPIGPGKPVGNVQGAAGKILGGWQINGIMATSREHRLSWGSTTICRLFNSRNLPNVVPGVNPELETSNFDPARDLYLDIGAFAEPAPSLRKCRLDPQRQNFPELQRGFRNHEADLHQRADEHRASLRDV